MNRFGFVLLLSVVGCGGERAANVRAYDQIKLGRAAHEAGRNEECIQRYDDAIKVTEPYSALHGYPDDWKFWWGQWKQAEKKMARAVCVHDAGRVGEAVSGLEAALKQANEALAHSSEGFTGIQTGHEKRYVADMNELLAKWKKEARK
jgi:hypothetical protein